MTDVFIFNNASRAAGYGIGTYVRQLADGLRRKQDTRVSLVEMYADTKEFAITEDEDGTRHYLVPPLQSGMESETYCRIIFYFLARNIDAAESDSIVFQFNYFQHYPLAVLLKSHFVHSNIVLTVHYMSWCFELKGNVRLMRKITAEGYKPEDDKERGVINSCFDEKKFLHLADVVIALSARTRKLLASDYKVSEDKMRLVYNGAGNGVCRGSLPEGGKGPRDILFVGRLDEIKGLRYLMSAFGRIAGKHPDARLVVVGDGDFQPYLEQGRAFQGRVSFLGKMGNEDVDKVYQSAGIGVMPSFHEQCSYTAIEMMRHGIPVIGTDSTGLAEMLDATPGLRVHIDEDKFDEDDFVSQIASRMDTLLSDDAAYARASDAVLRQYEERYTLRAMTRGVEDALQATRTQPLPVVSPDYLPHIDMQMADLINRHPDIDMDFYGMAGIGVYLWWRVSRLEKDLAANADQLALVKEYLIYYLDWVEEAIPDMTHGKELDAMLYGMLEKGFRKSMAERILEHDNAAFDQRSSPSEQEILHNALRICTCKI